MRVWVRVHVVIDFKTAHHTISSVLCPHKCSTRHPGYETLKCYHNVFHVQCTSLSQSNSLNGDEILTMSCK